MDCLFKRKLKAVFPEDDDKVRNVRKQLVQVKANGSNYIEMIGASLYLAPKSVTMAGTRKEPWKERFVGRKEVQVVWNSCKK